MANFTDQLKKIKTLLTPSADIPCDDQISKKPFAYSTLLHLQEQATNLPPLIQFLVDSFNSLLSFILFDVSNHDEEM